jgi:hypothetical protein
VSLHRWRICSSSSTLVDPEIGTLVWPNELNVCPGVLHRETAGIPIPVLEPARLLKSLPQHVDLPFLSNAMRAVREKPLG